MFVLRWIAIACVCFASSAATTEPKAELCASPKVAISIDFEMGRASDCQVSQDGDFSFTLLPENTPINSSPWYAIKLTVQTATDISLRFQYGHSKHRYWPKLSTDGANWQPIDKQNVTVAEDKKTLSLNLALEQGHYWVAAQPLIDNEDYHQWISMLQKRHKYIEVVEYGQSELKRPLVALTVSQSSSRPTVVIFGRQHPPEITGAQAMQGFVEALLEPTDLSQRFLQRFNLLIFPNLNPDGVAAGNWRHNKNGIDLNRDWGPFSQAETAQTIGFIEQQLDGRDLWMSIDFHSTWRDIFYYHPSQANDRFPKLVETWLARMEQSGSPVKFEPRPGINANLATTKTYFYQVYGVPALTYELGDNTPIEDINRSSEIAAQTLMELLLEWKAPNS